MQYLLLIYSNEKDEPEFGTPDGDAHMNAYMKFSAEVEAAKVQLGSNALQPVATATTVRLRNGQVSVTDGPFAETKEQLAGFYLVEARDLNEAIQLASRIPPVRVGSIEVRPIRELEGRRRSPGVLRAGQA